MKTNLQKAQDFTIGQCLSDYPAHASYDKVIKLLESDSRRVTVWQPFEDCDAVHIMDNMASAVERLLNDQEVSKLTPQELARHFKWDGNAIFKFCLDALTDANFHPEVKKLEAFWGQINHD